MEHLSPMMIKVFGIEPERGVKEFLNYNITKLRYLGIWRWDVPHFQLNQAFACLQIFALSMFTVSLIISCYYNYNDLDHLTKSCICIVFIILLIFKNVYLMIRIDRACKLICQLENEFFTPVRQPTAEQLAIINKYGAKAKFFTILRNNLALSIITFWLLAPIKDLLAEYTEDIDEDEPETRTNKTIPFILPFEGYFPYDVEHNVLNYVLTYIFEVFCGLSIFIGMPAWDMLFVSIFIHISGHFKALQHVLLNLQRDSLETKRNQESYSLHEKFSQSDKRLQADGRQTIFTNEELDDEMLEVLNNCIKHHQIIIRFVELLEVLLRPVMLMQLMASVIAFCFIGFQMSVIPISTESVKFIKLSASLISALVELGMFYWFGGELLEESALTLMAAYHCDWYSTDMRFRKNLRLLMERAKRPVKLTAGGFSSLTLESFASVIQSSYSYFTMLKAVHDEDDE